MNVPTPGTVLASLGVGDVNAVLPVSGGMSGALLWRVVRPEPGTDLLLRLLPHSGLATVEHEAAAQRSAHDAGIPTPRIDHVGVVAGCPVILMTWLSGQTMLDVLVERPSRSNALGQASGRLLRRIHDVAPVIGPANSYLGSRLAGVDRWLSRIVTASQDPTALIHVDFHPGNLIIDGDGTIAVLDWTNASAGDPLIDLGRTFACLQLGAALYANTIGRESIDAWWRGLIEGYGAPDRTIDELAPFIAFGLVTLVDDCKVTSPNARVASGAVQDLVIQRDSWLSLARGVMH